MERTLLEYADCRGLSLGVDHEAGIICGVKILGTESRNGRTYVPAAMEQARELYEGAKVNINHPKGNPLGPRDYQDRIGVIRNVSLVAQSGLFGDLHFNPRHALAGQLEWDAKHAPENVGLSHNVLARTSKRDDRVIVETITKVVSVDLVADPASTHGLFEEIDPPLASDSDRPLLVDATPEVIRERRPDLVAALQEEVRAELDRLRDEMTSLRSADELQRKRLLCERLLNEYELHCGEDLVEKLLTATDEKQMRRLLESHRTASRRGPRCREQQSVECREPIVVDSVGFVRLITG